jgi:hypothetical protein
MNEPWGYKVVTIAYVEGSASFAEAVARLMEAAPYGCEFIGSHIEVIEDEPQDQVAS